MKISIIIPAYNEERRIEKTLTNYIDFFKRLKKGKKCDFEIIVVINCSTDRTEEIVKNFKKKNKELNYLYLQEKGKGLAIIGGFREAVKHEVDLIGFVDADMSTSPEEYYKLMLNLNSYDGIIASRYLPESEIGKKQPLSRILISRAGNFIIRVLFFMHYADTQCGAKLFKKEVIEKVIPKLIMTHWAFDIDLLYQLKRNSYKIIEYPTKWIDDPDSRLNLKKASIQVLFASFQLRILHSPLKKAWPFIKPFAGLLWRLSK